MPTGCFSPQTMLTAISMSAIATNGVVPGRAAPVSVCVPGTRGLAPCRAFPRERPLRLSCSLGWAGRALWLPCGVDIPSSHSPALCHQPSAFPTARGEHGAATHPQSREVQMAARAASRSSTLRQTGEPRGSRGDLLAAGRGAGRAGHCGLGAGTASPTSRLEPCWMRDAAVCGPYPRGGTGAVWPWGAPGRHSPGHGQPRSPGELCQPSWSAALTAPAQGVIKAIHHPAATAGPSIPAALL